MDKAKKSIHYNIKSDQGVAYRGNGIRVAILDTGATLHPDFRDRIITFHDCINNRRNPYDDNGHGTHVAGILAGDGKMSGEILAGVAPAAELIVVKILNDNGDGEVEQILDGLRWIWENRRRYRIRIVNISIGAKAGISKEKELGILKAVERLWDAGLVVIVSAGNQGPGEGTITIPGTSRKVITVGAIETEKKNSFSGRGPTEQCVVKPDILAPGHQIISCNHNFEKDGKYYTTKSGTSMATPMVAGAAALLLSKYPDLSNLELKLWFRECSGQVKNGQYCGFGTLNIEKILKKK